MEGSDINEAFDNFCTQMWFPGLIYAQEMDQRMQAVGDKVNLRMPTNQGVEWEKTRGMNREGYGQGCARELIRICQQVGVKRFRFREDAKGEVTMLLELNERGEKFADALQKEKESKK